MVDAWILPSRVVDPSKKVPDLKCEVPDLLLEVVDLKQEVPDLRSGGIPLNLTPGLHPQLTVAWVNSASHPSGSAKSSTSLAGVKAGMSPVSDGR